MNKTDLVTIPFLILLSLIILTLAAACTTVAGPQVSGQAAVILPEARAVRGGYWLAVSDQGGCQ